MKKTTGIYKITSPTGRIYIGQSVFIEHRLSAYRRYRCVKQTKLFCSLLKHGWEKHIFEIIHICKKEELNALEKHYILLYKTFNTEHGLNLQQGGINTGVITEDTRKRISDSQKLRFKTQKHPNKGVQMSKEQKEKLKQFNTGKKHSDETRLKMSISSKGKTRSKEHQDNLNKSRIGKSPRKEKCKYCKIKMSFLLINKYHNENCLFSPNMTLEKRNEILRKKVYKRPILQISLNGVFIKEWESNAEIKRKLGIKNVSKACKGLLKTCGGFNWKYKQINTNS